MVPELMKVSEREAFDVARAAGGSGCATCSIIIRQSSRKRGGKLDIHRDFITPVLADTAATGSGCRMGRG